MPEAASQQPSEETFVAGREAGEIFLKKESHATLDPARFHRQRQTQEGTRFLRIDFRVPVYTLWNVTISYYRRHSRLIEAQTRYAGNRGSKCNILFAPPMYARKTGGPALCRL
jgi:hypothetical protein